MVRTIVGVLAAASCALSFGAAGAQGFSGSGAAGYAQSQGWTASPGVRPRGSHGRSTAAPSGRAIAHPARGR